MTSTQDDLFDPTPAQDADTWMHSPGGRHVMKDLYAITARLARDWHRFGIPIAVAYVFEIERHRIKCVRAWLQRRGHKAPQSHGYTLNNSHRASVARHIMARRQDWQGIFDLRELRDRTDQPARSVFVKQGIIVQQKGA